MGEARWPKYAVQWRDGHLTTHYDGPTAKQLCLDVMEAYCEGVLVRQADADAQWEEDVSEAAAKAAAEAALLATQIAADVATEADAMIAAQLAEPGAPTDKLTENELECVRVGVNVGFGATMAVLNRRGWGPK